MKPTPARPAERTLRNALLALATLAATGLSAAASGGYELTRFEDPRGAGTNFFPTGINNSGVITGTASFQHGFTLTGVHAGAPVGSIDTFDVPSAFNNFTFADDINNAGTVVGTYRNGSGGHGFVLDDGVYTTIDVPTAAFQTSATGINDLGQVVGQYRDAATGHTLGFVRSGNTFTLLNAGLGVPDTLAQGINNAGRVVGSVGGGGSASRGFTFENGVFTFFDAPGATSTQAFGINNAGQIVGAASNGLFVKDGGSFTHLVLPASWNARGAVATDITDAGVVVGYFTDNGTNLTYGFLATPTAPVPEPGSVAMLLAGLAALGARRRQVAPA